MGSGGGLVAKSCPTLASPWTVACWAPLTMEFSRQEYSSGLPFPSPKMKAKVVQSCPTLCDPMDYTIHGILQARILEWVTFPSPGDLPKPGIKPRSHALQADSSPAEPHGKPKDTGVGGLSLLQQIFPTQELNQDLLHCKWILYQLSYRGRRVLYIQNREYKAFGQICPGWKIL